MINCLRRGGADLMRARLESPRASYATPALPTRMTRAFRPRPLPTNHGHAARPLGATRAYQPDSSSKTPHLPPARRRLRNSSERRGSDPPKNSLDGRSFHISLPPAPGASLEKLDSEQWYVIQRDRRPQNDGGSLYSACSQGNCLCHLGLRS